MEESEYEALLISTGYIGELIERRAAVENILPFNIYDISITSVYNSINGLTNSQLKLEYLVEQKKKLIVAQQLYALIYDSLINYSTQISTIEKIINFIDELRAEFRIVLKQEQEVSLKVSKNKTEYPITEINTFCNSMPISIPKSYFNVFVEKENKNGGTFLTEEQCNLFIERAFYGKTDIEKQKFNQAPKGDKLIIQAVFYEFYTKYCFEYFNTMQCQDIFIKLLTENFEGWDFKNVKENFKPKTKKRL